MPIPSPQTGEVLVKIHASGVNPSDTKSNLVAVGVDLKCLSLV
ncbi:MAG: hypothetical protein QNJ53_25685 [Pleurocapsa sp. MO_192.B19]|nr:hypothetical protein [Pleurocapsa sp. MO_192.B19]